jgi:integrase
MNLKKIGGIYHAQFKSAGGKLTSVTTRCTDEREAMRVAKEAGLPDLERAAKAGRLAREAIGHIVTGRKITLTKALQDFEEWMGSVGKAPKTIHNTVSTVRAWMNESQVENLPPAAITEQHISKWINDSESDSKASTRAVNLAALRLFFRCMCAKGWSISDPAALVRVDVKNLDHAQREATIRQPLAPEQIKLVLKWLASQMAELSARIARVQKNEDMAHSIKKANLEDLGAQWQRLVFWQFAVRTADELGLRLGDICNLEWECFSKPGHITLWTDKTRKRLDHPISDALADLVTEIPVEDGKHMFPEQRTFNRDPRKRAYLSTQFSRILGRVGITGKSFHSIRHGTATNEFNKADKDALAKRLAEHLTLGQIAQLLGHSSTKTTKGIRTLKAQKEPSTDAEFEAALEKLNCELKERDGGTFAVHNSKREPRPGWMLRTTRVHSLKLGTLSNETLLHRPHPHPPTC